LCHLKELLQVNSLHYRPINGTDMSLLRYSLAE
jgi:hypothetical protein